MTVTKNEARQKLRYPLSLSLVFRNFSRPRYIQRSHVSQKPPRPIGLVKNRSFKRKFTNERACAPTKLSSLSAQRPPFSPPFSLNSRIFLQRPGRDALCTTIKCVQPWSVVYNAREKGRGEKSLKTEGMELLKGNLVKPLLDCVNGWSKFPIGTEVRSSKAWN